MKDFVKRVAVILCNIVILVAAGVLAIHVGDVVAPKAKTVSQEMPMECARLTDEEIEFLRELMEQEAGAWDEYEADVPPAQEQEVVVNPSDDVVAETHEESADEVEVEDEIEVGAEVEAEAEVEVSQLNEEQPTKIAYTDEELNILALIIYQEAGADIYSDKIRMMVGNVFLNRVESAEFPNTFYEVATAYEQYGTLYWTGIVWPERSTYESEKAAVERAFDCAKRLLEGERIFETNDVVWQAEFPQGTKTVHIEDGIYFCS